MLAGSVQRENLAARAGRWSARHWKTAVFGWLAFVFVAFALGNVVGTDSLSVNEPGPGESGRVQRILNDEFEQPAKELVLVQSSSLTAASARFHAAVQDVVRRLEAQPNVTNIDSPFAPGSAGRVSSDGHSALVEFDIRGKSEDAKDKVEPILAAVADAQRASPQFTIAEFGGGSANKAINEQFGKDLLKAGAISLPVTLVILLLTFGALVAAGIPLLLASDVGVGGDRAAGVAEQGAADGRRGIGGRPADRTRGRRRLLDVLPQAGSRGARGGTDGVRFGRGCSGDVGPLRPDLGLHGDGGDVRDVHQWRQDLRGLRGGDDARRSDFRPRLADRAAGTAVQARGPREQGPGAVSAQSRSARRREPLLGRDRRAGHAAAARLRGPGSRRPDRARRAGAPPADDAEQHGVVATVARRRQGLRQDPEGVPRRRGRCSRLSSRLPMSARPESVPRSGS